MKLRWLVIVSLVAGCRAPRAPDNSTHEGPARCLSGESDCAAGEYCERPTAGGAPQPPNEPGVCRPMPAACMQSPTCECVIAGGGASPHDRSCGSTMKTRVMCSFDARTLHCSCIDCP